MLKVALSDEKSCCFSDVWMFMGASLRAVMNIHVDRLNIYLGLFPTYSNNLNRSKSKAYTSAEAMLARDQATKQKRSLSQWLLNSQHALQQQKCVCVWIR